MVSLVISINKEQIITFNQLLQIVIKMASDSIHEYWSGFWFFFEVL